MRGFAAGDFIFRILKKMYICEKNVHFVANLACFRKFEVLKKMSKYVKKHVHLKAMMLLLLEASTLKWFASHLGVRYVPVGSLPIA